MTLKYIAILLATILLATVAAWAANEWFKLSTSGYVETEYDITFNPTSIDWGPENMTIGVARIRNVTLTNSGTRNITSLNMTETNFSGGISEYWLEWDAEDEFLAIGESIVANFTLTIYKATEGSFSFDIYVSDST